MKKDYLKMYAEHFELHYEGNVCYDLKLNMLIKQSSLKKYVEYKNEKGEWRLAKSSDLFLNILNNIPLHK